MNMYQHLQDRHLNTHLYNGVLVYDDVVVFFLWNLSGQLCGYQQYNPNATKEKRNHPREGRYYTSLHGDKYEKPLAVWGLESYNYRNDVLFITEGIFDACRFHNLGYPAVALLSSSYKPYRNWLTSTGRKVYAVEDDHGSSLGPYTKINIPPHRADAGECTNEEILYAISEGIMYE